MLLEKKPDASLHVATKTEDTASPLTGIDTDAEQLACLTNTSSQEQDLHVETRVTCPEDSIILSQYP